MLFNSLEFLIFLPIVFILYWFVFNRELKHQNILLLVSSYVFYGWWDYRFLLLIAFSSQLDYMAGRIIDRADKKSTKQIWLAISMCANLGILGFFKYYNFFVESWIQAFSEIGYHPEPWTVQVILPVGISFYTFQTMSYTLDVYQGKLKATKDFFSFATFVSFFPQLVAGPIERASHLLPQILKKRNFNLNTAIIGSRMMLWGLFKKVVIADQLAPIVTDIFQNYSSYSGGTVILGILYFSIQIYCDFSGYSDIAIGLSKLFGFDLMTNFKFPYFSKNIHEFWQRWHISLSTWFRDYLYFPLGGSRGGFIKSMRNVLIIFIVSGFWHGANFTYIAWGAIHGLLYAPSFIQRKLFNRTTPLISFNQIWLQRGLISVQVLFTFVVVLAAWMFFRAESMQHAIDMFKHIDLSNPKFKSDGLPYVAALLLFDWLIFQSVEHNRVWQIFKQPMSRRLIYVVLVLWIISSGVQTEEVEFIYFQF